MRQMAHLRFLAEVFRGLPRAEMVNAHRPAYHLAGTRHSDSFGNTFSHIFGSFELL